MRRAARVDGNHADIVDALRHVGCSVSSIASLGHGLPDLLVGINGRNLLLECKNGELVPSKRRLTADEQAWHDEWRGEVHIVESVDQALALVGAVRRGLT